MAEKKIEAASPPPLTLLNGAKAVTFRHMSVRDAETYEVWVRRLRRLTLAAFPALKALDGQPGFTDHDDFDEFAARLDYRNDYFPWLLATCNEPLTVDDLFASDPDEIVACCANVRRLNPAKAVFFPRDVQIRDETDKAAEVAAGAPDPNS